jgi:hypothetical protein
MTEFFTHNAPAVRALIGVLVGSICSRLDKVKPSIDDLLSRITKLIRGKLTASALSIGYASFPARVRRMPYRDGGAN